MLRAVVVVPVAVIGGLAALNTNVQGLVQQVRGEEAVTAGVELQPGDSWFFPAPLDQVKPPPAGTDFLNDPSAPR